MRHDPGFPGQEPDNSRTCQRLETPYCQPSAAPANARAGTERGDALLPGDRPPPSGLGSLGSLPPRGPRGPDRMPATAIAQAAVKLLRLGEDHLGRLLRLLARGVLDLLE